MKRIKWIISWVCQILIGKVRWFSFLVKVGNISRNSFYNKLTGIVMKKSLTADSTCIDVGCSKGEILQLMMKYSPKGRFLAFEPLPDHYENLVRKFPFDNVSIYNLALSDSQGTSLFNYVISNPPYSGLKKRPYDRPYEEDCQIKVKTDLLDNVVEAASVGSIDLIKIDVEGGEYLVLKGSMECLKKNKPVIIFEHGPASAKAYDFTSKDLFDLLCNQIGLRISLMQDWLLGKPPLTQEKFSEQVNNCTNYYFMAHK
jgi:FkbM family methyltransferase